MAITTCLPCGRSMQDCTAWVLLPIFTAALEMFRKKSISDKNRHLKLLLWVFYVAKFNRIKSF